MNRLPVVKAWIRERAQTVYTDNLKVDYVGGDPRFIVEHTYDVSCNVDGGAPFVKAVTETTEETHIKTFSAEQIEEYLATHFILPKVDEAATQDVTAEL